jgi:hypothetical protein
MTAHGLATEASYLTQIRTGFTTFITARLISGTSQNSALPQAAVDQAPKGGGVSQFSHFIQNHKPLN